MAENARAKILNVDDNEAGRYSVSRILSQAGFDVMEAGTGTEALNLATTIPDLVLLDVNLPDINGFEVCRRLKSNPTTQAIPILHLSATYKDSKATVNGLEGGADGYLTQPVEPQVLVAHIKALIRSSRMERRLARTNRSLKALSDCNQALLRAQSELELVQEVCRILVEVGGYRFVWVGSREPANERTVRPIATWGKDEGLLELATVTWDETAAGCCPMGEAIRTGKSFLLQDIRTDSRCEPWRTEALNRGFVSAFALPLIIGRDAWGAMSLCSDRTGSFDDEERELLFELTQDLAFGIQSLRTQEEARRSQEELRKSQERFQKLVESAPDAIFVQTQGNFAYANSSCLKLFGATSPDQLLGKPVSERIHPDDRDAVRERIRLLNKEKKAVPNREERLLRLDGAPIDVEVSAVPFEHQSNDGALVFVRDISERKLMERERWESAELFRLAFDNANIGVCMVDTQGRFIKVNDKICRIWGYSRAELENMTVNDVTHPEDLGVSQTFIGRACTGEIDRDEFEKRYVHKQGSVVWGQVTSSLVRDREGNSLYFISHVQDITARKRMEEALRESEERFRRAVIESPFPIILHAEDGEVLQISRSWSEITGYAPEEIPTISDWTERAYGERKEIVQADIERLYALDRRIAEGDYTIRTKDGATRVWDFSSAPLGRLPDGRQLVISMAMDVTELKRAETERQKFFLLAESSSEFIGMCDLDMNPLYVNPAGRRMVGLPDMDAACRVKVQDYYFPEDQGFIRDEFFPRVLREGQGDVEIRLRHFQTGEPIWMFYYLFAVRDFSGKAVGWATVSRDITEPRRAEQAERRLVAAIEQASEGVIITDPEGTIQYVNPGLERMTGYSRNELMGQTPRILKSGEQDAAFYRQLWDTIKSGRTWSGRFANRKKDGRLYHEDATITPVKDASGKIVNFVAVKRDITEHLQLSQQLLQAQKMEAIGTLAGGVAHDFNNILQVALGYSELILGDEKLSERFRTDVEKIHESARRGADLVQRLLTFSRKTEIKPQPLDINRRVNEFRKMLERTIPKMIDIQLFLAEDLATINADPTQVDQILMNLAVNARDAMPDGGKLIIETANINLEEEYARAHLDAKPGSYVLLMITDTGEGMDKDTVGHIFEPFYTTKESGQGTGLGLAMVLGIVQQHGGFIRCYSEPGEGTTFKIYFPAIVSKEKPEETAVRVIPRGGSETILLVDDEEMIRDLGSRILTKAGYRVIPASNGKEALEVYQARGAEIALVILDLIMPEVGGKKCLEGLLSLDPSVKVVIASGYSANGQTKETLAAGAKGFVNKPYDIRQVLEVVRAVLDEE